jgi:signal transduction histidine kinase
MADDLRALIHQLQATLGKMEVVLGAISEAIVWTGQDGRIQWSNATFDQLIERQRFDVLGAQLFDLLPLRQQGQPVSLEQHPLTQALMGQANQTSIYEFHQATQRFLLDIFSTQIEFKGEQSSAVLVIRDVTARHQLEQRQAMQFSVTRTLAQTATLEQAMPRILQAICQGDGWELGTLWQPDPASQVLRWQMSWCHPAAAYPNFDALSQTSSFALGEGLPGRVWLSKQPAWIPNLRLDANFPRAVVATQEHLQTAFAFPILNQGEVVGILECFSPIVRQPDDDFLLVMLDISSQISQFWQRQQAELQIQQQLHELGKLNRVKDDFLSTVSHELRTPIANMRMAIELLKTCPTPERQQQYLEILRLQCLREANLINDLLDLQRLEAVSYNPVHQTIVLQDWLAQLVEPFRSRVQTYQQQLQLHLPTLDLLITIDCTGLERILVELLNNACKYTPKEGTISLNLWSFQETTLATTVVLVISNQATIPTEDLPHIFEKFYRATQTDVWRQGGTGLGLALVQKLVEQMHGTIGVESNHEQTTFTVQLPTMQGLDIVAS